MLKHGIPRGSILVLAPMIFNMYMHNPATQAKKYGYAENLAILLRAKRWEEIGVGQTAHVDPVKYLQI